MSALSTDCLASGEKILDRKEINGRLPEQIDRAEELVLRNTRLATAIDGMRQKDTYEYRRPFAKRPWFAILPAGRRRLPLSTAEA